jgi:hypothetical protein
MTLSSLSISGHPKATPESREENQLLESAGIEKPVGRENAGLALPPFKVLLEWLHFYHAQTGTWPEPAGLASTFPASATANIPDYPVTTGKPDPDNEASNDAPGGRVTEKPLLKFVPVKSAREKDADGLKVALDRAASFDLKSSQYYRTALDFIENHSAFNPVSEAAILTLGSLLAWCSYPTFVAGFKEKGAGPGMYLPLEQWSKTLKMRKATLSGGLKELEENGLIKTRTLTPAGTVKRCYTLAVPLYQTLPLFDPAGVESDREPGPEPESINTQPVGTQIGSEQATMNHEQNKKFIQNENNKQLSNQLVNKKNHEHGNPVEPGTVEEKLVFLVEIASFPGYTSPEGLVTLDKREALKFAAASQLDLNSIKKIYRQTLTAWTNGKCTKNPLGFFHRALTAYLNQGPANLNTSFQPTLPDLENFPTREMPGTGNRLTLSSRFPEHRVRRNSSFPYSEGERVAANQAAEFSAEDYSGQPSAPDQGSLAELFNREQTGPTLQAQVLVALQDRFKQPELAKILAQLTWKISLADGKLRLELEKGGAKGGPVPVFGQSELSLLKIALSQRLRAFTGRGAAIEESFEIEILTLGGRSSF